jgi:hypothetical protein
MRARTIKRIVNAGRQPLCDFVTGTKLVFDYEVRVLPVDYFAQLDAGAAHIASADLPPAIDDTRKPPPHGYGRPLELVCGKQFQLTVLEDCLKSMLVDEVCAGIVIYGIILCG